LKVLAFDEARFGLINWHRRRYCPKGFRPPYIVKRSYKWTYLYAAVEPTTGESFCLYLPGMDEGCLEIFLGELSKAYPENHLLVVLDGVPEPVPLLRASHVREVGTAVDTPQIIHRVPDKRHTLSQRAVNKRPAGKPSKSSSLRPWKSASRTGSRGAALPRGSSRAAAYPKLLMPSTSRAAAESPSSSAPCPGGLQRSKKPRVPSSTLAGSAR